MALSIRLRVENDKVTPELKRLRIRAIPRALKEPIRAIAYDIRNTAMASLQTPKSGRIYRRGGIVHQASAPGEPPATDTGDLLSSITVIAHPKYTDVGSVVLHGRFLEEGTKFMRPRPWLIPAYEEHSGRIETLMDRELGK